MLNKNGYITERPIIKDHPNLQNFTKVIENLPPDDIEVNEFVMGDVPLPPDTRTSDQIAADEVQAELNHKYGV